MRNFLDELTILDRPPLREPQWMIDVNRINELPTPAIVAILLSIDFERLSEDELRAINERLGSAIGDRVVRSLKPWTPGWRDCGGDDRGGRSLN